uniref:Dynein heavy chain 2, axonemal n=1 Tax=Xenopus tropicalis TaxID=8364 RepID=A0A1B8Y1E3_XENTR
MWGPISGKNKLANRYEVPKSSDMERFSRNEQLENVEQLMYFIRKEGATLTPDNLEETLQFGSVRGTAIVALLRLMNGLYAPYIFSNATWPESIRNNFSAHVHRFLAALTDARYKLQGQTVLYIPIEALHLDVEVAVKDKELVQRLETAMVHWTRQIKEVLSAQEAVEIGESSGPLEEIDFWRDRCADLTGISKQLDQPGVRHIKMILEMAKSSYVGPFHKLSKQIQEGTIQAQSNLSFLSVLKAPFEELTSLSLKDIPPKLPRLLSLVRVIWVNSPFYNTRERLTSLFRKISNELIHLCSHQVSLDHIFDGYVTSSRQVLKDCIMCCNAWKEHYLTAASIHHRFSKTGWVLDQTSIFAQVDAFIQRCKDLLEGDTVTQTEGAVSLPLPLQGDTVTQTEGAGDTVTQTEGQYVCPSSHRVTQTEGAVSLPLSLPLPLQGDTVTQTEGAVSCPSPCRVTQVTQTEGAVSLPVPLQGDTVTQTEGAVSLPLPLQGDTVTQTEGAGDTVTQTEGAVSLPLPLQGDTVTQTEGAVSLPLPLQGDTVTQTEGAGVTVTQTEGAVSLPLPLQGDTVTQTEGAVSLPLPLQGDTVTQTEGAGDTVTQTEGAVMPLPLQGDTVTQTEGAVMPLPLQGDTVTQTEGAVMPLPLQGDTVTQTEGAVMPLPLQGDTEGVISRTVIPATKMQADPEASSSLLLWPICLSSPSLPSAFQTHRAGPVARVCLCQEQFARWQDGKQSQLPCFSGAQGPAVTRSLLEIEETFHKNLQQLKAVKKTILDVKNTSWHDDYNRFRAGVKDLEVMMQNLINTAFETVRGVEEGVELLDVFHHLSAREAIKRTFDKKTVQVYQLFKDELDLVNKELGKKLPTLPPHMCRFAGQGHAIRGLRRRIDRSMQSLASAHFIPRIGIGEEALQEYQQLAQKLDELMRKLFSEWSQGADKQAVRRLDTPLMARSTEKVGMLDVNFDKSVLKMFVEIHYWERLQFEIPHYVAEIYQRREELRNLRENVLLVVRAYNRIIAALSQEERGLFRERIRFLDKKIQPGLTKLHWSSKGASSAFISDCLLHASRVQQIVDNYKLANEKISQCAQKISESLLLHIDGKRVFRDNEFQEVQEEHRSAAETRLHSLHEDICGVMRATYEVFKADGPEVQQHWMIYTDKMDRMVEEAFRLNVKRSLQELSKAINGDNKTTANPLFRVMVILQSDVPGATGQVEFSPSLQQLSHIMSNTCSEILNTISNFRRLPDVLAKKKFQREPIHVVVERDEEIKKILAQINGGVSVNAGLLQAYLKTWDSFRMIWELNKDAFIRRYQHLNPIVSAFDADIARYTEVANNVQKQETVQHIQFVLLDCSHLKFALVQHCNEWQNKFTGLLSHMASAKLMELHGYLRDNADRVLQPPQTLEELAQSLQLYETLQSELAKVQSQIPPIHEQFAILEKYEVVVDEAVLQTLASLNGAWISFQQSLIDSESMLKKSKEKFKTSLIHTAEEFKKKTHSLLEEFTAKGPFLSSLGCEPALEQISMTREMMETLKAEENTIHLGLSMFKIEQPSSKDLRALEKDLDSLQLVWEATQEWEQRWEEWKSGSFLTLQTDLMESTAQGLYRRLSKLSRELKEKNWEIVETSRQRIDQFKRTMPLIADLRNPALRERHWSQVKQEVQGPFDETAEDFTLEKIVELGLDQHVEKISEISTSATKELFIEQGLENISKTWEATLLDIMPYKDKGHHRLRGTDDVFQALEDNQVALSTMKASPFVKAFEQDVDRWERCLSHILEVIEMILTVQRQWLYLENIFTGEDIRKQLPQESAEFDDINVSWKVIMGRLTKDNNALRGTHHPGLLEKLGEMNGVLEGIQKSLDMYLETKRHIFPRFYFISNDDLLEILGQSRNPDAVQPHLKKCFDNIKSLKIQKAGIGSKYEAAGMFSAEGEYVDFTHPVLLEGPVEAWLCDIERTMRWTLKELLRNCRLALKKMSSKRDKWVKEWAGQMLITSSQIQWTADVTKSLMAAKERGEKKILKIMKKKQVSMLNKYSDAIRGNLTKNLRLKLVALVTVEVHARDVIDKMLKSGCMDVASFEWLSQLRLYWDKDVDDCLIRQTNTQFQYGYEYLGNSGRLVITPLTDRCYMTLTTALHLHRGGSPKGPAGTGKTETVKDLGKALGMYVIVVNCSEGLDYKSMGRMYSGLAQLAVTPLPVLLQLAATSLPVLLQLAVTSRLVLLQLAAISLPVLLQLAVTSFPVLLQLDVISLPVLLQLAVTLLPVLLQLAVTSLPVLLQLAVTPLPVLLQLAVTSLPVLLQLAVTPLPVLLQLAVTSLPVLLQLAVTPLPVLLQLDVISLPVLLQLAVTLLPVLLQLAVTSLPVLLQLAVTPLPVLLQLAVTSLPVLLQLAVTPLPVLLQLAVTSLPVLLQLAVTPLPVLLQLTVTPLPVNLCHLTGAWGCFDEFNRINIEVLSVVAQQILSILTALSANLTRFVFEGREINLVWSCGIFITMNPGYAGRTELPDNLKSMFRPISMVVPDSTLIAEIILFGEGFNNCKVLAKKVYTLYSLAVQQLSKQDHYDFGLRALTSLLRYSGRKRRLQPNLSDEEVLIMAMKDMNVAKLTSVDLPLFSGIMQDLFPGIETPTVDYGKLREQIEQELKLSGLQVTPFTVSKVIQLYETKTSRHSTMLVGRTCSGKTTIWRCLQGALSALNKAGDGNYNQVRHKDQ